MSLHDEILAIRGDTEDNSASYALGMCDAKQEAAALAAKADAEIARLAGENSVLRGLLHESLLFVTQSIFGETEHEVVLERFADRIKAAIYGRQDGGLFDGGEK